MNMLLAVDLLVFLILAVIWTRSSALNTCLKILFVLLFVANLLMVLHVSGYIVKAP